MPKSSTFWLCTRRRSLRLHGSLDQQLADESLAGIVANLKAGANEKVELEILPSLNGLFQRARTGNADEYGTIHEALAPIVVQRVAACAKKQK